MTNTTESNYTATAIYEEIIGKGLYNGADFDVVAYTGQHLDSMVPPHSDDERLVIVALVVARIHGRLHDDWRSAVESNLESGDVAELVNTVLGPWVIQPSITGKCTRED